ncbi:resistin isoform X1 [Rattus norvegicus]|uniref:resistin isoform X1 n=1 Tax=Rattus norvegicus TaxID=10116 RepID=UPI002FD7D6AE
MLQWKARSQGTYYPRQDGPHPEVNKKELWDRSSCPEPSCALLSSLPRASCNEEHCPTLLVSLLQREAGLLPRRHNRH